MIGGENRARLKQVTASVSEEVYLKLHMARLYTQKPIRALIAEGCAIIAEHYRLQRITERATGAPALLDHPALQAAGQGARKVTGELSADAYLALWKTKVQTRRPIKVLVVAACWQIGEYYLAQRRADREANAQGRRP